MFIVFLFFQRNRLNSLIFFFVRDVA